MVTSENLTYRSTKLADVKHWFKVGPTSLFPENGGECIMYKGWQIAVFNFTSRAEWFACQNLCPHKMQMILARGIIGSKEEEPKVACPFHKKSFSLKTGKNMDGEACSLATYPVKVSQGIVYVGFSH